MMVMGVGGAFAVCYSLRQRLPVAPLVKIQLVATLAKGVGFFALYPPPLSLKIA